MSIHKADSENIKPPVAQQSNQGRTNASAHSRKKKPKVPKKITASYLRNSGLYYLQRFTSSTGHFRSVMMRKIKLSCQHHTEQNIDDCAKLLEALIIELTELGLLDDDAYGYAMVTSFRRRGFSKAQIMQKLRAKSMTAEQIQYFIDRFNEQHDLENKETELLSALRFAQKKRLGPFRSHDKHAAIDDGLVSKELGKFARAGFSYDLSKTIMDMPEDEAQQTLYHSVL